MKAVRIKASAQAKLAVAIEPKYPTAQYISGNTYLT
jgi:hypothetical protein